jgi:heme exporter protein D
MQWNSVAEFFAMGGYGPYVWGAYGVTALLLVAELVMLSRRGRALRESAGSGAKPGGPAS